MRSLVVVACLSSVASAETLRMKVEDAETVHIANQGGAINSKTSRLVTLDLATKGRAVVVSAGSNSEHNLWVEPNGNRSTEDLTNWLTTWKGTWVIAKGTLTLDLTLDNHDCTSQRTHGGATEKTASCKTIGKVAKLRCTTRTIVTDGKPLRSVDAWSCSATNGSELGDSAFTWVFGKTQCLQQRGGRKAPISWVDC